MGNYEYIISSLPALTLDWKYSEGSSFGSYVAWVKSQLGESDIKKLDILLQGYDNSNLNKEFYEAALKDGNRFLREFFTFDLNVRNAKARFLNKAFGRPADMDTIKIETGEFSEAAALEEILSRTDILEREHGLDSLTWEKIDRITTFNYFDLDAVLGFLARLHIIDRWFSLDEETGRDLFKKLVFDLHDTARNLSYVPPKDE